MDKTIIDLLLGFILGLWTYATIMLYKTFYFNSNSCDKDSDKFLPEFEVTDIELSYDENHNRIARYTVVNCFFAKKFCKNFKYQKFHFYDKIDTYKIGDKLTLAKLMK